MHEQSTWARRIVYPVVVAPFCLGRGYISTAGRGKGGEQLVHCLVFIDTKRGRLCLTPIVEFFFFFFRALACVALSSILKKSESQRRKGVEGRFGGEAWPICFYVVCLRPEFDLSRKVLTSIRLWCHGCDGFFRKKRGVGPRRRRNLVGRVGSLNGRPFFWGNGTERN